MLMFQQPHSWNTWPPAALVPAWLVAGECSAAGLYALQGGRDVAPSLALAVLERLPSLLALSQLMFPGLYFPLFIHPQSSSSMVGPLYFILLGNCFENL